MVALVLIRKGWSDYEPTERDIGRNTEICSTKGLIGIYIEKRNNEIIVEDIESGIWVERSVIPEILNKENKMIIEFYSKCKIFGNPLAFPFAGGWAEQPCRIIDVLEVLTVIDRMVENSGNDKR